MVVIDHFANQYIDLTTSLSPAEVESKTNFRVRKASAAGLGQDWKVSSPVAAPSHLIIPAKSSRSTWPAIDHFVNQYIDRALSLCPAELESKTRGASGYTLACVFTISFDICWNLGLKVSLNGTVI
ncbi:hypothetical protein V8F33_012622 [Rhypophila sp. PSN 637]